MRSRLGGWLIRVVRGWLGTIGVVRGWLGTIGVMRSRWSWLIRVARSWCRWFRRVRVVRSWSRRVIMMMSTPHFSNSQRLTFILSNGRRHLNTE
jgi:hypothetical protein